MADPQEMQYVNPGQHQYQEQYVYYENPEYQQEPMMQAYVEPEPQFFLPRICDLFSDLSCVNMEALDY